MSLPAPAVILCRIQHTANANNATFWLRELMRCTISMADSRGLGRGLYISIA